MILSINLKNLTWNIETEKIRFNFTAKFVLHLKKKVLAMSNTPNIVILQPNLKFIDEKKNRNGIVLADKT